jgi:hypothetical protein
MADFDTTSKEYKEVLRLLALLNSSVEFIVLRLKEISSNKVFSPEYMRQLAVVTKEVERYIKQSR